MTTKNTKENTSKKKFTMPDTWVIIVAMVVIVAILSWIVPAGSYDYEQKEINGTMRNLAIDGTFHYLDKAETTPTGVLGVFSALYRGCVEAASTVFMIFTCCATFRIMVRTGSFHSTIGVLIKKLGNKGTILACVLLIVYALCGSVFGMFSELYGFYPLMVGLGVALGYDAMYGFAILALGEGIGFMCGTLNPYSVAISQSIAEVRVYSNMGYRWFTFVVIMGLCMVYLLMYGKRIKADPRRSVLYGMPANMHSFSSNDADHYSIDKKDILVLVDLLVTLVILGVGLLKYGWGNEQLCGLFIIMSIVAAVICGWSSQKYVDEFVDGVKGIVWGGLIAGLSRGILVVMNDAMITDTVIHALAELLKSAPQWLSAQMLLVAQTIINAAISSSTGQAAVTMPIMAPLADALGLSRDVACLAYQYGSGMCDLVYPTADILVLCSLGDIPYGKWMKWFMPLAGILFVAQMLLLGGAVMLGI